ncbi:MAG TPA: response regulator [Verrucomicrobiae bacterium]|nr:response regulator [Verrucomicrobiae bacterium]
MLRQPRYRAINQFVVGIWLALSMAGMAVDFNKPRSSTLLATDDDDANRQGIAGIFEKSHHRLVLCSNGEDAVVKDCENRPDIVLVDLRMPGMDRHQALAGIRKFGLEHVPAIAVTGSVEPNSFFSGFLRKSFSPSDLFNELPEFLPRDTPWDSSGHVESSVPDEPVMRAVADELHSRLRQLLTDPWRPFVIAWL